MNPKYIYNVIVAAGSGSRFGASLPKQFCMLEDRPVLMHTIENMQKALPGSHIILVLNPDFFEYWDEICRKYGFHSPKIVAGGNNRWQSVKNAISQIPHDAEIITIHDGARPIVDKAMVCRVINALDNGFGAIPVVPITDSLRQLNKSGSMPVNRELYRAVQTPQAFHASKLREAYTLPYDSSFTDDASVMSAAGYDDLLIVDGDSYNIKITHPLDIEIASIYLRYK